MSWKERFNSFIRRTDRCWYWTSATDEKGYGLFWLNGQSRRAHRLAYSLAHPEWDINSTLTIDHICEVKNCVNPDHLQLLTRSDHSNIGKKTHCGRGHEFTEENTGHRADNGKRYCKECHKIQTSNYRRLNPR